MDDDEIWFQYRGHATNDTEWGCTSSTPARWVTCPGASPTASPATRAFSVTSSIFAIPCTPRRTPPVPGEGTTFEVETVSFEELPALAEAKAREAANPRRGGAA